MKLAALLLVAAACTTHIDGTAGSTDGGAGGGTTGGEPRMVMITGPTVLPHVQTYANAVCGATNACTVSTYVGHSPSAERAIDTLVSDVYGKVPTDNNALGDTVAQYALDHQSENKIMYVIWRQRYNDGGGWSAMEDRGSITQNHYDHVHVSFYP